MSRQVKRDKSRVVGWSPQAAERLKRAVKAYGSQEDVARLAGISRQSLASILNGHAVPQKGNFSRIVDVLNLDGEAIVYGAGLEAIAEMIGTGRNIDPEPAQFEHSPPAGEDDLISLPALRTRAAAGDGSVVWGAELATGPFRFARDWLRREFGRLPGLRLAQIAGDSQLPDLADGDWVVIDEGRNRAENGLAVILLDDCLMIKRLHREGHFVQLISRNPIYAPTAIDLTKEGDRLKVIGKVVYQLKRPS